MNNLLLPFSFIISVYSIWYYYERMEFPNKEAFLNKNLVNWGYKNQLFVFRIKVFSIILILLTLFLSINSIIFSMINLIVIFQIKLLLLKSSNNQIRKLKPGPKNKVSFHRIVAFREVLIYKLYSRTHVSSNYESVIHYCREISKYHMFNPVTYRNDYNRFHYERVLEVLIRDQRQISEMILKDKSFIKQFPKVAESIKNNIEK